jgi:hypothetical protein
MRKRWPIPHPLPSRWPRRKHYALIKISAPKGVTGPEARREIRTMVNELRYSDGFPGEIRIVSIRYVSDVTRLGLRYHLTRLPMALGKGQMESSGRRQSTRAKLIRRRKHKAEAAKDVVARRRKSPWN